MSNKQEPNKDGTQRESPTRLSRASRELLHLCVNLGTTNTKQIADYLGLSIDAIDSRFQRLMRKHDLHRRDEIVYLAIRERWISPFPDEGKEMPQEFLPVHHVTRTEKCTDLGVYKGTNLWYHNSASVQQGILTLHCFSWNHVGSSLERREEMKSFVYGAIVGVTVTLGFLLAPSSAYAQWVDNGGYQIVGTTSSSGIGPGAFDVQFPTNHSANTTADEKTTTNSTMSSSIVVSRTLRKSYTWSGSLPNSGTFNVYASGTLSGNATATPTTWGAYVSASSSSSVSFPPSGGVSSSSGSCSASGNTQPGSYSVNPAGNIVVTVGSTSSTFASFDFTINAAAAGSIGVGANAGIADYHGAGSVAYNVGNIVP